MSDFNVWGYLARLGTRVLGPGECTLQAGDEVCAVQEPILLVLEDVEEFLHQEEIFSLDYRCVSGDVSLPENAFRTQDFLPHGKTLFGFFDSFRKI